VIAWYLAVKRLLRTIDQKARDAIPLYEQGGEEATAAIKRYITADYQQLWDLWEERFPDEGLGNLGRHIHFGMGNDYRDIIRLDLPDLERRADQHLQGTGEVDIERPALGFEDLLHPMIQQHAFQLYRNGHLREAVLNSITAVFDFIRERSGLGEDGDRLIGQVFTLENPKLILSEIETDSGQNDQKGFMQIFKGAYQGVRNPKAHSLNHDLTEAKAAEYLIFASLLARRVEEATKPDA
jgi:uncharacterized protein (TIGR02391 family)